MRSLGGFLCIVLVAIFGLPQAGWAWGEIRIASTDLNVRAARRVDAPKIVTLKKGQRVKVDFLEGKWVAVFPENTAERDQKHAIGYAGIRYLQYVGPAPEVEEKKDVAVSVKPEPLAEAASAQGQGNGKDSNNVVQQTDNAVVAKVRTHVDEVKRNDGEKPVKITSDRMVYNEVKRTVVFEGTVRAEHQDLVLFSDTLTAYFVKGEKAGAEQIERIVARGNVTAQRNTTKGQCSTLTYMVQSGVLRMEGNPVLKDGGNTITGQVIKFYLKDNRSEVVGGKHKRVQAVFSAPKKLEP